MTKDERYLPFFIGIGISELSIEPATLPKLQEAIQKIDSKNAFHLAESLLNARSVAEVEKYL
jgi:phosphoenolpyruvate-protein kinase (PTS system EI component)